MNELLSVAWPTVVFSLLIGCGLSAGYASLRSHWHLKSWRDNQLAIGKNDLIAIKAVYQISNLGRQSDVSNSTMRLEIDAMSKLAIEALTKGGELLFSPSPDLSLSDHVAKVDTNRMDAKDIDFSWSVEPNGFNRLKLTCALVEENLTLKEIMLARRFAVHEMPSLSSADKVWAFLLFGASALGGLWMANKKLVRKRFLGSLIAWTKLASQTSTPVENAVNEMETLDPKVAAILKRASAGIHTRLDSIQRSVEQSSRVMSAMPVGVLAFDQNLKLLFVNRAGSELLGLGSAVQFGQSMIEVIRQPNVVNLIQQVSAEPQIQEVELELPLSKATLRLRAHPLSNPIPQEGVQSSSGVLLTLTDETRLKQLENARRDFTANVSHELKTPLSAIKAYAETLLMGALEDEEASQRFVERIAEQANRLDSLIRDLLHLTRLQSQPDKPQLSDLLLDDVLKTCVEEHRTIGQAKKISIDTSGVENDCRVEADLESLRTIIGNLLGNAVRYNRDEGWVRVSTRREDKHIVLIIADNGIGIPPEDLDRIFERFYRVEKARSQDSGGTGLGLSIVKHLVQSMSAEIHVSSVLGSGSSFELRLKRTGTSPIASFSKHHE